MNLGNLKSRQNIENLKIFKSSKMLAHIEAQY
jgi:hypothetical protein